MNNETRRTDLRDANVLTGLRVAQIHPETRLPVDEIIGRPDSCSPVGSIEAKSSRDSLRRWPLDTFAQ
jgi:hypothetical protein